MFAYASVGALIGGAVGGIFGKLKTQGSLETPGSPVTPGSLVTPGSPGSGAKDAPGQKQGADADVPIPESIAGSIEKLESLCTREGRDVCTSLKKLYSQIYFSVNFIESENAVGVREKTRTAQTTITRLGLARQMLDKLYTVERERYGNSDEFLIYKTNVTEEMNTVISKMNNYITKNMHEAY